MWGLIQTNNRYEHFLILLTRLNHGKPDAPFIFTVCPRFIFATIPGHFSDGLLIGVLI